MRHIASIFLGRGPSGMARRVARHAGRYGGPGATRYCHLVRCTLSHGQWTARSLVPASGGTTDSADYTDSLPEDITSPDALRVYLRRLHDQTICLARPGDAADLLMCIFVAGHDSQAMRMARQMADAANNDPTLFQPFIVVLSADFAPLWKNEYKEDGEDENNEDGTDEAGTDEAGSDNIADGNNGGEENNTESDKEEIRASIAEKANMLALHRATHGMPKTRLFYMRNINSHNIGLDLDEATLCGLAGEFVLAAAQHSSQLFGPNVAKGQQNEVTTLGMAVMNFDRQYMVEYLQHRAFIQVLDGERIGEERVDINKAYNLSQERMQGCLGIYTKMVEEELLPKLKDHKSDKEIVTDVYDRLDHQMDAVAQNCLSVLALPESQASLPLKKAALAMMLGEDDPLLDGKLYQDDALCIDDCTADAMRVFVDENNKHFCLDPDTLSVVSTLPDGREPLLTAPLNKNGRVYVPLQELRDMRYEIRQNTNYIRSQRLKMAELEAQTDIAGGGHTRLTERGLLRNVVEHPLEAYYEPTAKTRPGVDLRQGFTPVKDQGQAGACSAFALTAIIEYCIKKKQQGPVDLSERFLFYNARQEKKLDPQEGVSFYDILQSAMKTGICDETLCRYDALAADERPTDDAFLDGSLHKVLRALSVRVDHQHIASALSEGYPVGVSLRLFDSFDDVRPNGFAFRPSEAEIERGSTGNHAMVIVGYSEENKIYIVRNSWGAEWGDNGYCYIPFGYIDDPRLCNGCYIVTSIDNIEDTKGLDALRQTAVEFSMIDAGIQYSIARILCDEAEQRLRTLTERYTELRTEYTRLFERLCNQSTCDAIRSRALARLTSEKEGAEAQKAQQTQAIDDERALLAKQTYRAAWRNVAVCVGLLGFTAMALYYHGQWPESDGPRIAMGILGSLTLLSAIYAMLTYYMARRRMRELTDERTDLIARFNALLQSLDDEQKSKKLHMHVAGQVLAKFSALKTGMVKKYAFLGKYLDNLRLWRAQEQQSLEGMRHELKEPFVSVLDDDVLARYFDQTMNNLNIHPYALLLPQQNAGGAGNGNANGNANVTANGNGNVIGNGTAAGANMSAGATPFGETRDRMIDEFRAGFMADIDQRVQAATAGFSITDAIAAPATYAYITHDEADLDARFGRLKDLSEPFVRFYSDVTDEAQADCHILAPEAAAAQAAWTAKAADILGKSNIHPTTSGLRICLYNIRYTQLENVRTD